MAEAKLHNGKAIAAYVDGQAVDSEGAIIPGAPKPPKDTDPSKQPGANGLVTPEERSASLLAAALAAAMGKTPAKEADKEPENDDDEDDTVPTLAELPDHLAALTTVDDVKALQKRDKRKGAKDLYKTRLAELEHTGE